MTIVKPYARMILPPGPKRTDTFGGELKDFTRDDGVDCLRRIEWAARFSHATEDAQTEDSWERFVRAVVIGHGDWSVVEHASVSVDFLVDRGVTHELVRHRLFGFTQSSTRFINYVKKMPPSFIYPDGGVAEEMDHDWQEAIDYAEEKYKRLIAKGWPPQKARSVFPNALSSRIFVTGNLRNGRHALI